MKTTVENFIGVYENAYSPQYCKRIINHFENMKAQGLAVGSKDKIARDDEQLYVSDEMALHHSGDLFVEFNKTMWDAIYSDYQSRFGTLEKFDRFSCYGIKVQKTQIGQGYHYWHCETSNREVSPRILTFILYLNDVEEGGETEFLYYPKRIKPKTGTFILWPAGFTHTHRGNPPISNTKYVVTGWMEF